MPETIAQRVRAKFPGAYDDLDDVALEAAVLEKHPDYADLPRTPTFSSTNAKDAEGNAVVDPNTVGTFARHVGQQINPLPLGQMIPFPKAAGGGGIDAPIQAAKGILHAQGEPLDRAIASYKSGDYGGAAIHALNYLIPLVGPIFDKAGNEIRAGNVAAGVGDSVGLGLSMFGGKPAGEALSAVKANIPAIAANVNPAERAAVAFGESRGIPVDAATATGNRFVKGVQAVTEHSPLGSMVAERAKGATADALTRVSGELADEAHPVAVTAEQAGSGIREGVRKLTGDLNAQANTAYEKLRAIETKPEHAVTVRTAPEGSTAHKSILGKLAAGAEDGQAPTRSELVGMRQIAAELDAQTFSRGKLVRDSFDRTESHYAKGASNADVYHEIGQVSGSTMSGKEMLAGIQKTLETGDWNTASRGALAVAQKRLRNSGALGGPQMPPDTPLLGTTERVQLPVDLRTTKTALQPLYDRLKRESELIPLQGDKGRALVALDRLVNGPDHASLSIVDAALGDLKSMARADIPELRTQGQGLAANAVKTLDRVVNDTARKAGPEALDALEEGRGATVAKYQAGDVLETVKDEPVQAYRQAVAPKDSGIKHLREIANYAPAELPKVARAYLEHLFNQATSEGGFEKGAKLFAEWQKLGTETKHILFPAPGQRQSLDHFFLLTKKLHEPANSSKTALVTSAGAHGALIITNPATGIPLTVASGALAKLLRSRAGVNALTRGMTLSLSSTGRLPAAVQAAAYADVVKAAHAVGVDLSALPKAADQEAAPQ